jgi:hypothetical protein
MEATKAAAAAAAALEEDRPSPPPMWDSAAVLSLLCGLLDAKTLCRARVGQFLFFSSLNSPATAAYQMWM